MNLICKLFWHRYDLKTVNKVGTLSYIFVSVCRKCNKSRRQIVETRRDLDLDDLAPGVKLIQ